MSPIVRAGQIGTDINPLEVSLADGLVESSFNDWIPDLAPVGHPGLLEAMNAVPLTNSFGELKAVNEFTAALDGKALAHTWVQSGDAAYNNFAADSTKIYRLSAANTWTTVGSGYAASSWEFVTWGNFVVALSPEHAPQVLDTTAGSDVQFGDLPGSPPQARTGAVMRDFMVLGRLQGNPNRVQWSGYDNISQWGVSASTLADYQNLPPYLGRVQRIVPGEYALIFTEHGIVRMGLYDSPSAQTAFRFDVLERGLGTPAPQSVCWIGDTVFFYSQAGFYAFDGQQVLPIGGNVVDRWFRDMLHPTAVSTIQGRIDRADSRVYWAFRSKDSSGVFFDSLLIYNFEANRWSWARAPGTETELLTEYIPSDLTLEDLDALLPANGAVGGIDTPGAVSFDNAAMSGGGPTVGAFSRDHKLATLTGNSLPARFTTGERSIGGDLMFCENVRFLIETADADTTNIAVTVRQRDDLLDPLLQDEGPFTVNDNGDASTLATGRFQRYQVDVTGGFKHAYGIIPKVRSAGDIGS